MSGPRDESVWRQVGATPPRPGWPYFAAVALACLILGAVVAAWALRLL